MTALTLPIGPHHLGYSDDGAGQPVVLLHSGGFSSRQWRRLRDTLIPTHRVLVPDLLGYGASGAWPAGTPFHFHTDVAAIVALLATLDQPAHLVGHSYGGLLALHAALARPARSLALYEPVAFGVLDLEADSQARAELSRMRLTYEPDASGVDERWLADFVDWWNAPGAWAALSNEARAGFRSVGWKLSAEVFSLLTDPTDLGRFATITAPTLLLGGDRSPATEQRVLERLAAGLPHATLQRFAGLGHMGPISHAALVNDAICAHLRAASGK
jgi:pimeloyl-ACP methyl ester carboxylesterase